MIAFDGTKCAEKHIVAYKNLILLYTTNPTLLRKFFPTTLTGLALIWYTSLPARNINTFVQLEAKFLSHFVASKRQEKSNFHLLGITQLEGESVSTYLQKFHNAVLEVTNLEKYVALSALINGMRTPKLKLKLIVSQVKTYAEAMKQYQSFVTASNICQTYDSKKRKHDKMDQGHNNSSKNHDYSSKTERGYPPRHQGRPFKMGPPRSRQVYATEEEPRTRNLRDEGNDRQSLVVNIDNTLIFLCT